MNRDITIEIPAKKVHCYIVYDTSIRTGECVQMEVKDLPGHQDAPQKQTCIFTVCDASMRLKTEDKEPLQLDIFTRSTMELSCIGVSHIRGFLTGNLFFQNSNTPREYDLMGQLVDIGSKNSGLNVSMFISDDRESESEPGMLFNGEATQMDISGLDLFPNMRMWLRENVYLAPVSLLGVLINMYHLPKKKRTIKVRVRKVRRNDSPPVDINR